MLIEGLRYAMPYRARLSCNLGKLHHLRCRQQNGKFYSPGWQVLVPGRIFRVLGITDKREAKFKNLRCQIWKIIKLVILSLIILLNFYAQLSYQVSPSNLVVAFVWSSWRI